MFTLLIAGLISFGKFALYLTIGYIIYFLLMMGLDLTKGQVQADKPMSSNDTYDVSDMIEDETEDVKQVVIPDEIVEHEKKND